MGEATKPTAPHVSCKVIAVHNMQEEAYSLLFGSKLKKRMARSEDAFFPTVSKTILSCLLSSSKSPASILAPSLQSRLHAPSEDSRVRVDSRRARSRIHATWIDVSSRRSARSRGLSDAPLTAAELSWKKEYNEQCWVHKLTVTPNTVY